MHLRDSKRDIDRGQVLANECAQRGDFGSNRRFAHL
jgi:hypothetical protein